MKRSRVSPERLRFERQTLKRLAALGVTPSGLKKCRWALSRGRRLPGDDYCTAMNKAAQERAGIELLERTLKGDPPESIIFRIRTVPETFYNG